jgi:transposase InsO family protein
MIGAEWLTAREIAAARLPGLPHSKRKVNALARRGDWLAAKAADGSPLARRRNGKGGGLEFHVSLLPQVSRGRLEARAAREKPAETVARDLELMGARDLSRRDARLFVLARADDLARARPDLARRQADEAYAALYAEAAAAPDWVRAWVRSVSRASLERWRRSRDQHRLDLVAGRHSLRQGTRQIERALAGDIATFIGALIVKQPFLTAAHVRGIVAGKYGEAFTELPSTRAFQRFMKAWKCDNAVALRKAVDPDGFKSAARLSGSNANDHVRALNQLWEIDASPADVMLKDGRHSVYAVIDIWSRRGLVHVTKTPKTEATLELIRRAIIEWGVPRSIKTDNGSDFTSKRFVGALNALAIGHETSQAFSPEQKGTVERFIGTLQRGLMRLLPGFVGHSVADRKTIEARKSFAQRLGESDEQMFRVDITSAELQTYCDRWADEDYAHAAHDGLAGLTPFAKAASWTGTIDRIENLRALDLLLAPVAQGGGWRQATKQGLKIDGAWYIAPELDPGARYFCRQDPADMGRVHCFGSETGNDYVTTAVAPERAGLDPRDMVRLARARQAELLAAKIAEEKKIARRIKPRDMIHWYQHGKRAEAAKLAQFPRRSQAYESEALAAAAAALAANDEPSAVAAVPAGDGAAPEHQTRTLAPAPTNIVALPETPERRFARALAIEACLATGETVDAEELLWLGSYRTTAQYRSFKYMAENFGRDRASENG